MKSKLLVAATAAFFVSTLALANGYAPQPVTSPFDGPYLGIGAGVVHNVADAKASYTRDTVYEVEDGIVPQNTHVQEDFSGDKGQNTVGGTVFAGWGHTFGAEKNWYLAGELYGRYSPANGKYTRSTYIDENVSSMSWEREGQKVQFGRIRTNWFYGAQAKAGYTICPHTIFYLAMGVEATDFHVSHTEITYWHEGSSIVPHKHTLIANSFNHWGVAPVPGVGFMTAFHNNWILGGEYSYAFYGPFSSSTSGSYTREIIPNGNFAPTITEKVDHTVKTKIKSVNVSQFLLTLAYRFDV